VNDNRNVNDRHNVSWRCKLKLKLAIIGCGIKSSQYITTWINRDDIEIIAVADPNEKALKQVGDIATNANKNIPVQFTDWQEMLATHKSELNSVYICTPHASHAEQAISALNANLDVLLEKPMVTTLEEAELLNEARIKSNKEVVIAYQGGLSPLVHQLRKDIESNKYGELASISASIWENWADTYTGHWKQVPAISGGGFMFDTGAHMMNTMSMLCGQEFQKVAAFMSNKGKPVDVVTTVMGTLTDGTNFSMHACGKTIGCTSRIECFFSEHIVRICAWGRWVEIENAQGEVVRHEQESANNLINIFQLTLTNKMENPSSVTQGIKMAKLWDSIKESAKQDGQPVQC